MKKIIAILFFVFALSSQHLFAYEIDSINTEVSGYAKTLNFLTKSTGLNPELADMPLATSEKNEDLFRNLDRVRLQTRTHYDVDEERRVLAKMDYDHQTYFGSHVGRGDFRLERKLREQSQLVDLSQTLVEEDNAVYEHRLYRASVQYQSPEFDLEVGRQFIPWGVGYFFTPTNLFSPFRSTQLEIDERDGVDAVNISKTIKDVKGEFIYTPRGKRLHPQRFLSRFSKDVKGYETGLITGFVHRDYVAGFDARGNLKDSAVRGEFLYTSANNEGDSIQFTMNADYNFPKNIYGMLEYHFNGAGHHNRDHYELDRLIRGDIQQLARNYLAAITGYDITELLRFEHRAIFNMDDVSFFFRPEFQYSVKTNLVLTVGAHIFAGDKKDELTLARNLYFSELKFTF